MTIFQILSTGIQGSVLQLRWPESTNRVARPQNKPTQKRTSHSEANTYHFNDSPSLVDPKSTHPDQPYQLESEQLGKSGGSTPAEHLMETVFAKIYHSAPSRL
ncbi:hypothetical protein RRG08_014164 [Elysia crispata]|uniref:Uncharacterized protein n=1 Tax=Elysia crispata TaxID=231223 RepID=A0AAE0Z146_9GAST|nr:hypothetical protein RRG08_014164 [Elysia crispata]